MRIRSYFLIIAICSSTILLFGLFNRLTIFRYQNVELEKVSDLATLSLEENIETYIATLYGVRGILQTKNDITQLDFNRLITSLALARRAPGVNLIGYAKIVTNSTKLHFLNEVRNDSSLTVEGNPNFKIHPDDQKSDYLVITHLEPSGFSDSKAGLGFDLLSEEKRKQAFELARDTNRATMTSNVTSAATGENTFILMLPVFAQGKSIISVEDRRAAITGAVTLGLKRAKLFNTSFQDFLKNNPALRIKVYEGQIVDKKYLVYDSNQDRQVLGWATDTLSIKALKTVNKVNKTWMIEYSLPQQPTVFLIPYFVFAIPLFLILGVSIVGFIRTLHSVRTSKI